MIGVYGDVPAGIGTSSADAVQTSPLIPGSADLADLSPESFAGFEMLAPPGTLERRAAIARVLLVLTPGAPFLFAAPKDKGGSRIARELAEFGVAAHDEGRRHHRILTGRRPDRLTGIDAAIAEAAPRLVDGLGLWSEPGVFSFDRIDPGTAALLPLLPNVHGVGADFGCGLGVLSAKLLQSPKLSRLTLVDIDRRAVAAARRNITDPRAEFRWADVRTLDIANLDFVVMNPPFHDGGIEDKALGLAFIDVAARALKPGGRLWMVANRHLPYEEALVSRFSTVTPLGGPKAFKLFEARR